MHALIFVAVAYVARMFTSKNTKSGGEKVDRQVIGVIMLAVGMVLGLVVLVKYMSGGSLLPHVIGPAVFLGLGIIFLMRAS